MTKGPAGQNLVRRLNSALILDQLLSDSPQSRASLAQQTGLNRSTISSLVHDLFQQNLIREVGLEAAYSRGRPGMLLELNPAGGCVVGIEINVEYISVILTDFTAHTLWRRFIKADATGNPDRTLDLAADVLHTALRAGAAHGLKPLGIGVALPGLVNADTGTLVYAPNLQWSDVNLRERWGPVFDVPLYTENDGTTSALGEYYFGVAKGCRDFIYLGTGVGLAGGLMLNGEIYRGAGGFAGEIGHIIVQPDGELCGCGRRGCWETQVGPRTVFRRIVQALADGAPSIIPDLVAGNLDAITMDVVVDAADQGDPLALDTLSGIARSLGTGIVNLIHIFNPDMVVLGGSLTLAGDYVMPVISEIITTETIRAPAQMVALALSSQGTGACVKGAVALVIDGIVRKPLGC
jgi:predicted NBD/HSP70 family sugar kinase